MTESRSVSTRILWMVFDAMLVATALFAAGDHRAERAARLTLDWVDNSGGIAKFIVERKTGTAGTYVRIATTGTGITSHIDTTIVAGTTYCYRVKASNALGESGYSRRPASPPPPGSHNTQN